MSRCIQLAYSILRSKTETESDYLYGIMREERPSLMTEFTMKGFVFFPPYRIPAYWQNRHGNAVPLECRLELEDISGSNFAKLPRQRLQNECTIISAYRMQKIYRSVFNVKIKLKNSEYSVCTSTPPVAWNRALPHAAVLHPVTKNTNKNN